MSRPSAWGRVWQLFKKSFGKDDVQRKYVAEDLLGNKYYEIVGTRHNVRRGYDPATPSSPPPVREWQAWLKGTRRFPPSDEEININLIKQQAQRVEYSKLEQQAPQVETKGPGAGDSGPKAYPKYEDLEYQPGVTQKHEK